MTEELLEKAKEAQSPEELLTLMHENGMEDFTQEDAESLYAELHMSGELTDEALEKVSGGGTKVRSIHRTFIKEKNTKKKGLPAQEDPFESGGTTS